MPIRVVLNHRAARDILRSEEVRRMLEREAKALAADAGPGFVGDAIQGSSRARGGVVTATPEAMLAEARHRALTRALGQRGRGIRL